MSAQVEGSGEWNMVKSRRGHRDVDLARGGRRLS
jgi:hypothetical protein